MDKKLLVLLLVVFIDLIGFGIVIPILPLVVERIGGGTILVGIVIAVFSLFQFIFAPILGRLSDKYGRRPILLISSLINAFSYFLIFLSQSIWVIFLGRMIAGIGSSNLSVAQAYIADTSKSHERTKRMAFIGAAFGLGFIVGPLIGGVVSAKFGIAYAFLIPAVLSFLNSILIYIILPESKVTLQKHVKIELFNLKVTKEILQPKNMAFLLFLFFFVNLALALIIGVFPLYSEARYGWNEEQNGYYFGLIGVGSFVTQIYVVGQLLKKFNEAKIIRIFLLIFGVAVIGVGLAPFGWMALLVGPFTAVGFSVVNVSVQALISLESKPEEQGIALGVAQSFASMARVFGPIFGGIIAVLHINLPYVISGILAIIILGYSRNYLKHMK